MVGSHAWFERLSTPYACSGTSGNLSTFLTKETLENVKLIENTNILAWCLELVIQGHEKIGAI
jgi:hypothetical protein